MVNNARTLSRPLMPNIEAGAINKRPAHDAYPFARLKSHQRQNNDAAFCPPGRACAISCSRTRAGASPDLTTSMTTPVQCPSLSRPPVLIRGTMKVVHSGQRMSAQNPDATELDQLDEEIIIFTVSDEA